MQRDAIWSVQLREAFAVFPQILVLISSDRLLAFHPKNREKYVPWLMYMQPQLCNLRLSSSVCSITMATAQHISNRRAAVELRALPGLCQGLIRARSDMSEGEGRRIYTHTHWISSYSSWLETPMAIAAGIHSPRILGQLCR